MCKKLYLRERERVRESESETFFIRLLIYNETASEVQVQVQEYIEHKQYMFIAHTNLAVADIHYTYNNI